MDFKPWLGVRDEDWRCMFENSHQTVSNPSLLALESTVLSIDHEVLTLIH